jgi:phospholipase/carboxylesterase
MARKSPLLLLLHGYGSNEEDLMSLALQLDQRFFAVSARAPYPLSFGGSAWCLLSETADGLSFDMDEAQSSLLLVEKLIDEAIEAYDLDPAQVYVMGFSQGAALALTLALNNPDKVAGAVVMSGKYLEPLISLSDPKRLEGKSIFVAHGLSDDVLPIAEGRLIRDKLSETPVALSFHEYLMGHTVSVESFYDIAGWLAERLSDAEHEKRKA